MAVRALDVAEQQVAVRFPNDPQFEWHTRLLLRRLDTEGRWVAASPDFELEAINLREKQIVALARGAPVPERLRAALYHFDDVGDDNEQLAEARREARALALVLGADAGDAAGAGDSAWVYADTSHESFGDRQFTVQAVYMEDMVTLQHLVRQRADLDARDETGATPLHVAATQCRPQLVSWLVAQKADLAAKDRDGFTALTWSCLKGNREVVAKLIAARADVGEPAAANGKTPLTLSAERGHMEVVEELLASRASHEQANGDGSTPLMCAAHGSEAALVAHLLARNSPVGATDNEGWTALMYAANAPLSPPGATGDHVEKRVIIDGVMGKRTTVELLLLHKSDVNAQTADGLSALIVAATHDRPAAVRQLLECRAQVNMSSIRGQTPLLMAAAHDLPEVVRVLIVAEADVNAANAKHDSPLSISEKNGYKEVVDLLKKAGAVAPKGGKKKGAKKK